MARKPEELIISKDGTARGIVSPLVERIAHKLGDVTVERASHVEPTNELSQAAKDWICRHLHIDVTQYDPSRRWMDDNWWADLLRQKDGVVLGPFDDRQAALDAEEAWLRERNIPVCTPCRTQTSPSPPQKETP